MCAGARIGDAHSQTIAHTHITDAVVAAYVFCYATGTNVQHIMYGFVYPMHRNVDDAHTHISNTHRRAHAHTLPSRCACVCARNMPRKYGLHEMYVYVCSRTRLTTTLGVVFIVSAVVYVVVVNCPFGGIGCRGCFLCVCPLALVALGVGGMEARGSVCTKLLFTSALLSNRCVCVLCAPSQTHL